MKTYSLLIAYLLSIPLAVFAVDHFGIVAIPGGYQAPAAVYVVGITLVLRDLVHEVSGWKVAFGAVLAGALLSSFVNPQLALASGVAFLVSETLDLLVFQKVRNRIGLAAGSAVSNLVSIPIDSMIFLSLAFGSFAFLPGQIVGKLLATAAAVLVLTALGWTRRRQTA